MLKSVKTLFTCYKPTKRKLLQAIRNDFFNKL